MVETSRTSHVVMSPISSHYHHYLPPPPPLHAAATIAVEPPGDCPLLGQSGVSSLIPPVPNDAMSPPPNTTNDTPYRRHITRPQHPQYNPPIMPHHPPNDPNKAAPWRHVTAPQRPQQSPSNATTADPHCPTTRTPHHCLEQRVGWLGEEGWSTREEGRMCQGGGGMCRR